MIDDLSRLLVAILYLSVFFLRAFFLKTRLISGGRNRVVSTALAIAALWTHFALLSYVFDAAWIANGAIPVSVPLRLLAVVVATLAFFALIATHWFLDDNFSPLSSVEGHALVTSGPYRFVRHPMYSSLVVMLLAIWAFSANWFVTGPTVMMFVVGLSYRILIEEEALGVRFGWRYQDYKDRTPMFVPFLH